MSMSDALLTAVIMMTIVFTALFCLYLCIRIFSSVVNRASLAKESRKAAKQ